MERQPRDRGLRRHVVRGRRQGHGRGKGPRLLREAGGDEAADTQRPYAHDRARGRGRDPDRTDALQSGGGQVEGARRADRPEAQRIIKAASRVPVNRTVDSSFQKFNFRIIDLSTLVDEWDTWEMRWQTLFLKGTK